MLVLLALAAAAFGGGAIAGRVRRASATGGEPPLSGKEVREARDLLRDRMGDGELRPRRGPSAVTTPVFTDLKKSTAEGKALGAAAAAGVASALGAGPAAVIAGKVGAEIGSAVQELAQGMSLSPQQEAYVAGAKTELERIERYTELLVGGDGSAVKTLANGEEVRVGGDTGVPVSELATPSLVLVEPDETPEVPPPPRALEYQAPPIEPLRRTGWPLRLTFDVEL